MDGINEAWTRWLRYWRRVLPGASEEEIRRRAQESAGRPQGVAGGLYGENLEDSFSQWNRWLKEAGAWIKRFQKNPPWEKITQSGAWQGLTRRRW